MSEPKVYDVAPLVVAKEAVDMEQQPALVKAIVKEMRKDLGKKEWARAAEFAAQDQRVNFEDFSKKAAQIGSEVETDENSLDLGQIKQTEDEKLLVEKILDSEKFARKFFEVGYQNLEEGEKEKLRDHVLEQAMRVPLVALRIEGRGDINGMDTAQKKAFAERLILDPTFTGELKKIYNNLLEKDFTNSVVEALEDLNEAKNGFTLADEEYKLIEAQAANAVRRLKSFELNSEGKPAGDWATNAKRLEELRHGPENNPSYRRAQTEEKEQRLIQAEQDVVQKERELSDILAFSMKSNPLEDPVYKDAKRNKVDYQNELNSANLNKDNPENTTATKNRIQTVLTTYPDKIKAFDRIIEEYEEKARTSAAGTPSYETANNNLKTARDTVVNIRQELARLKGYEDELKALETEQSEVQESTKTLEEERRESLKRKQLAQLNLDRASRRLDEAKLSRYSEEQILAEDLDKAGGAAAAAILSYELKEVTESFDAMFEKVKRGSQSDHERALYVTLQKTWLGNERVRKTEGFWGARKKETYRPIKKAQILIDYRTLLEGGDVALVRSLIARTINPDTGRAFKDDEIDDVFDKNPTLVEKFKPDAVKQLLARKAMVGGFTPEDSYIISSTPWGQNSIEAAYNQNSDFRELINKNFEEGALKRHGFWQRFGQELARHPFWWTVLLGIPALFKTAGTNANRDVLTGQR